MDPSPKQRIYLEILEVVLPLCRSAESLLAVGSKGGGFILEADLLHNVPPRLLEPEFDEADLHWLNVDARSYVRQAAGQGCFLYEPLCAQIAELFTLVPEDLKPRLKWDGLARS